MGMLNGRNDLESCRGQGVVTFARQGAHTASRFAARAGRRLLVGAVTAVVVASSAGAAEEPRLVARKSIAAPSGFAGVCARYRWACARIGQRAVSGGAELTLARQVNRAVNRRVRQVSDRRQYGNDDVWTLPTAAGGDCEDIALLKKKELIQRGVAPENLLVATVLDLQGGSHAVLVLRASNGDLVLDNLRSTIIPWRKTGYTFLRMQNPSAPHRWSAVFAGGMMASAGS